MTLSEQFPCIALWVASWGWIEVGWPPEGGAVISASALDEGGCVWAGEDYDSLDQAMQALEAGIRSWLIELGEDVPGD